MKLRDLRLHHFNPRCLNLLGLVFGGSNVRVLLSERSEHALTVILESRSILLNPKIAGLYDLALGVRLLAHPKLRSKRVVPENRRDAQDDRLTAKARTDYAPDCQAHLEKQFANIRDLHGHFNAPDQRFDGLRIATRTARLMPLSIPEQVKRPFHTEPLSISNLEYTAIPEVDLDAGDDFAWLIDGLMAGTVPTHTLPMLDDLPFVRIPLRVLPGRVEASLAWVDRILADPESENSIAAFMKCIREKSEVREEKLARGRRTLAGVHFDTDRLVDAVLAARTGADARLFRTQASFIEPLFDPDEHLAVLAFDLGDVWRLTSESERFFVYLVTVFQRLGVAMPVIASADRLIELPNGRHVCLHFTTTLKTGDEPVDDAFWSRFSGLVQHPLALPGKIGHFHPLMLQDITRVFEEIARHQSHTYRTLLWWARRWMSGRYDQTEFVTRAADSIDYQMRELQRSFEGTFDTLVNFLPLRLRNCGRPGEYLSGVTAP